MLQHHLDAREEPQRRRLRHFPSSLELSDTKVYEPYIRARLGTAAHFCEVVVLKLRTVPGATTSSGRWRRTATTPTATSFSRSFEMSFLRTSTWTRTARCEREILVANRATLPQKWPPPPRNVADLCELTATTKQTEPSISRGRVVKAEGCKRRAYRGTSLIRNSPPLGPYRAEGCKFAPGHRP